MAEYSTDSSFNMGIAHLARIDSLLYAVADASGEKDYCKWLDALNLLNREVFFLYNSTDMEISVNHENTCAIKINEYFNEKTVQAKSEAYNALVKYEYFIKKQLADRKMLMAFSKDLKVSISDLG
jgi:hypothetical protein